MDCPKIIFFLIFFTIFKIINKNLLICFYKVSLWEYFHFLREINLKKINLKKI